MASPSIADDVRRGLTRTSKAVPPYLFYDDAGSRLYERITELPEYYLTSAEHSILEMYADAIVRLASDGCARPTTLVELGAGSAHKTMLLLRALVRRQGRCVYVPIDVSRGALEEAQRRIAAELPWRS
jgi:uncharacterized SAM-dependent methyltransferase